MTRKPAWLSGRNSNGSLQNWELKHDVETIIGRKEPAHLTLPYPRISRRHASICYKEFSYHINDLGSKNGTFVNGKAIAEEEVRLIAGDEIVLGGIISLKFNDPDETMQGPMIGRLEGIWIDPLTNAVWIDALPIEPPLSAAQHSLLALLYDSPNIIVPRDNIIKKVWPDVDSSGVSTEAVDGVIKRLRLRLREAQPNQDYVEVVRGHGLRLNLP